MRRRSLPYLIGIVNDRDRLLPDGVPRPVACREFQELLRRSGRLRAVSFKSAVAVAALFSVPTQSALRMRIVPGNNPEQ